MLANDLAELIHPVRSWRDHQARGPHVLTAASRYGRSAARRARPPAGVPRGLADRSSDEA